MTRTRKVGITALILYTQVITVLRALRSPNDFAEAHWLLDYRFGFIKRGLIGEIVSLVTGYFSTPITEQLIATLASALFFIFCATIALLSLRIIWKSGWSTGAVLVSLVFLSSPFIVMSAHLVGYYDNIVIVFGILATTLLLNGRPWLGICLLVPALLVHENSLMLAFAPFCLAWLLMNSRNRKSGIPTLSFLPLLLPFCVFLAVAVSQELFVAQNFKELASTHLSHYPFIQEERSILVPQSLSTSFLFYYSLYAGEFPHRVFAIDMHGLVLPSAFAILFFVVSAYRIRDFSAESLVLFGVSFAPQLMQLVATDTVRIWTYTIICAFLALWIYVEIFAAQEDSSASRLLCLAVLVANTVILTPLMDFQSEHFDVTTRLLLYAPVVLGSLALILFGEKIPIAERLSIQGSTVSALLYPTKQGKATSSSTSWTEAETPKR